MSEGEKKPDRPKRYVRLSMDELKAVSDKALAALESNRGDTQCAAVAVEKFDDWAWQVSRRDNDRTEVEAAYANIERILLESVARNPVMRALHAKLMTANRYCKRVAKELIPESDIRRTLQLALSGATRHEADILREVEKIARAVEAVFAPEDGPPNACFSGEYEAPKASAPSPPPSPRRVIDIGDDEEEIPGDALRTPGKFDN